MEANIIQVEVAYALPDKQKILTVDISEGATAKDAIEKSGIIAEFPEIDIASAKIGIFGKLAKMAAVLRPGDRVEIYRPLIADPKLARKKRAADAADKKKES